jgi:hypothetical protein
MQYARVPIELVALVDSNAVAVYVVLCDYAHRTTGRCWPSNPELVEVTALSLATVKRALLQLERVGAIERKGRQSRKMHVVPFERLRLTGEPRAKRSKAHPRATYGSPVSHGTRTNEPENTPPLRDVVTDESEQPMHAEPEEPMFEIEVVERPKPTAQAAVAAFCDAYGTDLPMSRSAVGRMAQRFKALSATYSHDELVGAAQELGEQRIANPNAIEPFVLRRRQPRHVAQQQARGWSALAADTFAASGDPFAADV